MNSLEIQDKKAQLKLRMKEIVENCKKEIREMNEEEKTEFDANKAEIESLNSQLEELKAKLQEYEKDVEESSTQTENEERNKTNKTHSTMKEFRLLSAINKIANNRNLSEDEQAYVNAGANEMRKAGLSFAGQIQIPVESRATIAATVDNVGKENVATDVTSILEPLRAKNVLVAAGAKYMSNLIGDVQVPVMGAGNVTWENETATAKDGAGTFSAVKLQPKRLTAFIDISKQFLVQDSNDAEAIIRQDLINAINSKLEATILGTGTGSTTEPAGLFATAPSATTTDYKKLAALEATIEDANVINDCKYIMSNSAKATFRTTQKGTGTASFILEGNEIDGQQVLNTSNVEKNMFAYGDWSNLAIGQWGAIDLVVDPYTKAADGQIRLVINAYFDAKVLRDDTIVTGKVA
ncbi:phage major capsid protein [Bacteroides zhangwenhongii]|jgi:HK97 family phage major capsid protein|uniref:phage major capsid protein n=1 Tax=Bacteroides zhangwenhongii TaxID=2650157 RepID=UPI0020700382|nr:phage major capsid protein [Bacteroides zhangwenhongii]DAT68391.1 MAG TPA: major capsid protein [Caudoviricetes sp.]